MSILIKGLKLPPVGIRQCIVSFADNCLLITDVCGKILFESEYVEVPTPHGRLIDADTVEKRLQKYWYEEYPNQEASYHRAFMDSNACVKDLPTIIGAEVSE